MPIADRLEKQETLRDWLRWQLDQTERTIRDLRAQQEEERRREVARREFSWRVARPVRSKGTRCCTGGTARMRRAWPVC
ncbi:hypothetical protein [Streptomyces sp. NPDC056632]|uniref:hypothetical protein n=1 Tax=Streptomyces sp. NPDC056632 TaxID=3345884 RepID=UPI0036BE6A64